MIYLIVAELVSQLATLLFHEAGFSSLLIRLACLFLCHFQLALQDSDLSRVRRSYYKALATCISGETPRRCCVDMFRACELTSGAGGFAAGGAAAAGAGVTTGAGVGVAATAGAETTGAAATGAGVGVGAGAGVGVGAATAGAAAGALTGAGGAMTILAGLTNIPQLSSQLKYCLPLTNPLFLPLASSSSTPIQTPFANSVSPTKRTEP